MMKIKSILIASLFFNHLGILGLCSNPNNQMISSNSIKEIKIRYVDIDIETPINVSCENFETYFETQIKTKKITEQHQISKFIRTVNTFLCSAKKYSDPPDVRIKIILLQKNGDEQDLCIGRLISSFKGKSYINTNNFLLAISRNLK